MPDEQVTSKLEEEKKTPPNPEGKGGFGDNPDHINKEGRPPNEVSITYYMREFLKGTEEGRSKSRMEELAEKIVTTAFAGNTKLIREVIDRIEGKPVQPIKHSGEISMELDELASTIQKMLTESHAKGD